MHLASIFVSLAWRNSTLQALNSTPKDHIGRAPIDNERNSWCNFRIESGENHVPQGNTHCDNEKESNDIDHGLDGSKLQWF
jgi:hypothetical protein